MTAFELNAAVYRGLQALSGNEDYMRQVLSLIKKLTKDAQTRNKPVEKIHVDRNRKLSLEKYLPLFDSSDKSDDQLREDYMKEKYSQYL